MPISRGCTPPSHAPAWLASRSYLHPGRYETTLPISAATLNRVIDATVELIRDPGEDFELFTVHDLRRTASTLLHEAGFNSDWIEKCLAHACTLLTPLRKLRT